MHQKPGLYKTTLKVIEFATLHLLLNAGLFAGHKWLMAQLVAG